MKAFIVVLVTLSVLSVLAGMKFVAVRNDLAKQKEEINRAWSNIDSGLQLRADLISKLLVEVKSSLKESTGTEDSIAKSSSDLVTAQSPQQKIDAYNQMNGALLRLLGVMKSHPNLKTNKRFESLQSQLEGAEDQILQARQRYNEAIQKYNTTLSLFPNNIVAALSGFTRDDAYFKTDVNARTAPKVTF